MSAPLNNLQKSRLAQLATRAWRLEGAKARGRREAWTISNDDYRHDQVTRATGKLGLRCCSQDDYKRAEAHFLDLLGETGKAFQSHVQAETEPRRVAEWKVVEACKEFGYSLAYAEAICRNKNKGLGLEDVGVKALWQMVYTIRKRGQKRNKVSAIAVIRPLTSAVADPSSVLRPLSSTVTNPLST